MLSLTGDVVISWDLVSGIKKIVGQLCRIVSYRTMPGRGTEIVLHLKEDAGEFLSESSLKELIHRYSEFITFPIYQLVEKQEEVEVEDDDEEEDEVDAGEDLVSYLSSRPEPNVQNAT